MPQPIWCHFEFVDGRGPYTIAPNYFQQNKEWEGKCATKPLSEILFQRAGENVVLWLIRDEFAQPVLVRKGDELAFFNFGELYTTPRREGIAIEASNIYLKPGDGFEICPPGFPCWPGPVDQADGRPRPTLSSR